MKNGPMKLKYIDNDAVRAGFGSNSANLLPRNGSCSSKLEAGREYAIIDGNGGRLEGR
jgi:hypothetical protein